MRLVSERSRIRRPRAVPAAALALAMLAGPAVAAPIGAQGVRLAPATPGAVRFTVSVPAPELVRVDPEQRIDRLDLSGYAAEGDPGTPAIPVRAVLVAVPPLGDVRLTVVATEASVRDGVTLAPNPGLDAEGETGTTPRTPAAYGAVGSGEPVGARLLGVTWMRNQRVARVLLSPVAYEPAARRLTVAGRLDVELAVAASGALGPPAEANDPFESVYRLSLVNYEQGRAWRRPGTAALASAARRMGVPLAEQRVLAAPPDTSVFAGRAWIKFAIQKTGFYAVNFSSVRQSSLFGGESPTPFDSLRLFTWPGRTVLPEDSYCDSCDYREVAIGIVRDVGPEDAPADQMFSENQDAFYFFAQGPDGWESDMDDTRPDTSFITHPYDRNNFYYLAVGTAEQPVSESRYPVPPRRIGTDATNRRSVTPDGSETTVATVPGRVHVEQDAEYWPDATAVGSTLVWEKWFWRSLTSGQTFSHDLDLLDADIAQPARFRLRNWGLSDNHTFGTPCDITVVDHLLDVSVNDVVFPRRAWNGMATDQGRRGVQTFDTTGVFLRRTGNQMTLTVPVVAFNPNCRGRVDRSGLAFYEIYYERQLVPAGDAIEFRTRPGSGRFRYDIGPFVDTPPSFVFDITDPLRPVLLEGAIASGIPGAFTLSLADTQSVSHRYAVVPDSILQQNTALLPPGQITDAPVTSLQNLRSATQRADDLIIYYDGFRPAAESLATWRSDHLPLIATPAPHVALAIPISALFDQFSGGRTDPGAIRNFLRAASGWSRRPLYVTFLGDASFDFKDITGRASPGLPGCLLPTFENNFDALVVVRRQYATDDWLVNVDDPKVVLPDYLTGRIPVADAASAVSVVTGKILGYERHAPFGEYRSNLVLMADDQIQITENGKCDVLNWTHLTQTTTLDVSETPLHMDREYVYLHTFETGPGNTKPGARVQLFKELNAGTSLFNYVGHGSPFKMTDEGVFLDTDAGTLTNGLKMPLMVAASCDVGKFNDPSVQSLGERILISSSGGCIAVVSATELALSSDNSRLNGLVYHALFNRDTLTVAGVFLPSQGQYHVPVSAALVVAKYSPFSNRTNSSKYQLMGDPATLLNLPRLWADVAVTDPQGAPVTSLERGRTLRFSGQVLDRPGGSPVALDGVASVLIEDSAPTVQTPAECNGPVSFVFSAGPMYHGDVTLEGGRFAGQFVVPMDAATGASGRVRAYVNGREAGGETDGAGTLRVDVALGTAPADDEGPRITLSFLGGSTNVRPDATLQINLFDEHGIMTTGHAPQNSIIVTVDDNTTSRTDVTETFRYAADSYQSGTASFQLPNLSAGTHRIKVQAADNLATGLTAVQHRSSAAIEFQVVSAPPLRIARTFLFPNPVRSGGAGSGGVFVVDAPGDSINVLIRVYSVAGKLVRVLRQMGGIGQVQVGWDGLDAESERLAQGTYLYKVYAGIREADGKTSPRQNATAEGRFVVLSP